MNTILQALRRGARMLLSASTLGPLSLLALLLAAAACGGRPAPRGLVLITLDTVRYDHLNFDGYPRDTAPNLSRLAERSVVFSRAFSPAPLTAPAHATMFTGVYPYVHGLERNGLKLLAGGETLAEILRRRGFRTAAFVSGVTLAGGVCGLNRGFEVYDDDVEPFRRPGRVATGRAVDWLRALRPNERFFLFLHLYDAHGPYLAPREYRSLFHSSVPGPVIPRIPMYQQLLHDYQPLTHLADYLDRYDDLIRYEDTMVWRILSELDLEQTIVVVLADHGETLNERYHSLDHGAQLFDEQVRIPFLLSVPRSEARSVSDFVETVDLLPTRLELFHLPAPHGLQGHSLVPFLDGGSVPRREFVFATALADSAWFADRGYRLDEKRLLASVRSRRFKLIVYPGVERDYTELYDLERDPGETVNLAAREPQVRAGLAQILARWQKGRTAPVRFPDLTRLLKKKLRSLGYVH